MQEKITSFALIIIIGLSMYYTSSVRFHGVIYPGSYNPINWDTDKQFISLMLFVSFVLGYFIINNREKNN